MKTLVISKWCSKLWQHFPTTLKVSFMLPESSTTLLENIYSTCVTHDDCHLQSSYFYSKGQRAKLSEVLWAKKVWNIGPLLEENERETGEAGEAENNILFTVFLLLSSLPFWITLRKRFCVKAEQTILELLYSKVGFWPYPQTLNLGVKALPRRNALAYWVH
jgi:hypothetical protein